MTKKSKATNTSPSPLSEAIEALDVYVAAKREYARAWLDAYEMQNYKTNKATDMYVEGNEVGYAYTRAKDYYELCKMTLNSNQQKSHKKRS